MRPKVGDFERAGRGDGVLNLQAQKNTTMCFLYEYTRKLIYSEVIRSFFYLRPWEPSRVFAKILWFPGINSGKDQPTVACFVVFCSFFAEYI